MELRGKSLDELEAVYRDAPLGPTPSGRFRGDFLGFLDNRGARRAWVQAADHVLFVWPRFGVDFDSRRWWFVTPGLQVGRFEAAAGPSRWRDTETYRLTYSGSRLPFRGLLYDELKPLTADVCLGVGGMNADRGEGEHFFFALRR